MLLAPVKLLLSDFKIAIMHDKEKLDPADKKESKFLVPFSPNTPWKEGRLHSTVFLTPPSTGESSTESRAPRIPCFPREAGKIPFDLTPEPDEFEGEYVFDIISKLYDRSTVQTVFKTMFEYLDDISLFRASLVCRKWRNIIRNVELTSKDRVTKFIDRKRQYCKEKAKENVGLQKRSRDYAQSILENTPTSAAKIFKPNMDSLSGNDTRLRPCPKCNSPAKVDDAKSYTCAKCNDTFCMHCLRTLYGHNADLCTTINTTLNVSPKRSKSRKSVVGSKKSKERLKRLSFQRK